MTELLRLVACPTCREALQPDRAADLRCARCGRSFPVEDGIPVLLPDLAADDLKLQQARFFDDEQEDEFEITRPHGGPALYAWQYEERFRRSVSGLRAQLPGATALTICGGSGMDAEFLALSGCRVISSDISLGAARRARERASRRRLEIVPVVADAEHLPFADRSIDVVYVHDGLHHLERPLAALGEMARVARLAVSVNEPARAALTSLAVRAGLALEVEESGNRVARLTPDEIGHGLQAAGFSVLKAERFALYFRHRPGRVMNGLSTIGVLTLVKGAILAANRTLGQFGNKVTVQGVRAPSPSPVSGGRPVGNSAMLTIHESTSEGGPT